MSSAMSEAVYATGSGKEVSNTRYSIFMVLVPRMKLYDSSIPFEQARSVV